MSLKGLRVAYAAETEDNAKVSAARVKLMTGKDTLTGRWPNDKFPITFEPTHTLFLLSNFKPHADSEDKAFWSRMINIPFTMRFLKNKEPAADNERVADPELDEKLKKQAAGILAWMVEGCLIWKKHGLQIPVKVQSEGEDWQAGEDDMGAFVDYCCYTGDKDIFEIGSSRLFEVFEQWWRLYVNRRWVPSRKKLGTYLKSRFESRKVGGVYKYYGIDINWDVVDEFFKET